MIQEVKAFKQIRTLLDSTKKGNSDKNVATVDKSDSLMESLLNDSTKLENIGLKNNGLFSFVVNQESD